MASTSTDDEDLIDLEGRICVSRISIPDATVDEQEHLLDVCPPKLEQKLSLTREKKPIREECDNGDILVTLGHDQVVPIRKRIDVVSSETIKRVRDITKNLEPVITPIASLGSSENPLKTDEYDEFDGNCGKFDENCGKFNGNSGKFDGNLGKFDGNCGKFDGNCRKFDEKCGKFDGNCENFGKFDGNCGKFDGNCGKFDGNCGKFDGNCGNCGKFEGNCGNRGKFDGNVGKFDGKCGKFDGNCGKFDGNCRKSDFEESAGSTEDQAISAFDFLSELDDETDDFSDENPENREISREFGNSALNGHLCKTYPLEPTCLIKNSERFHEIDRSNRQLDDNDESPVIIGQFNGSGEVDNLGFEVSPPSKKPRFDSPVNCQFEQSKSPGFGGDEGRNRKRDGKRLERKSWSGDSNSASGFSVFGRRSSSVDVESCQPSTSGGIGGERTGRPVPSASSSDCSEVDWSWVEELEHPRSSPRPSSKFSASSASNTPTPLLPATSPTMCGSTVFPPSKRLYGCEHESGGELEGQEEDRVRMRHCSQYTKLTNGSVAMSVDGTRKSSSASPRDDSIADPNHGNDSQLASMTTLSTTIDERSLTQNVDYVPITGSISCDVIQNSPANSWVRASMRRLRHLRLPEAERPRRAAPLVGALSSLESRPISAPNSLPDIALIAPEILAAHTNGSSGTVLRPSSAPVARNSTSVVTPRRGRRNARSRTSASGDRSGNRRQSTSRSSSRDNSISGNGSGSGSASASGGSGGGASASVSPVTRSPQHQNTSANSRRPCERQREAQRENEGDEDDEGDENPLGKWPHALSPALACLGCTLGLFNISRFAILSVQFGANFIVQFLVLSLILGIPLLTLQVCLGQRLAAGAVDMWKISPVFHGVGIALLVAHAFIGIYSIIGISWMFIYFRDSFITKQDRYRWAEPFHLYREDTKPVNTSIPFKLHETVPDYFSGVVLQRHHLNEQNPGVVTLKFQVAFNLAVVWMIVFVSLSKGLRSYGKVVYVFTLVPVFGTLVLCTKLLGLTPAGTIHQLFPATVWNEFFINNRSWVAASSEVFLTWGLLGAAAMQIAAHNKHKHLLQRDTSLVIVLTLVVLLLAAFLANTCVQILRYHGYIYTTSSFEKISGYIFMRPVNQPAPSGYSNTPERFMSHASFLLGQRTIRPGADLSLESGYQALRLSTELVPATLAVLGTEQVSPFWAVLFYFILILFGIAQQLAIWHCVITGIMAINTKMMKLWETTITFFSCACAYILGLPMATEFGIYVVYYLDYTVGGAWWIMVLYLVQVGAVFAVRGRPHTGEAVVAELFPPTGRCLRHWAGPLLSFTWNVVLPVTLMVLSITLFKSSSFRDLYMYRRTSRDYWAVWARQLGAAIQLIPILIIPAVAIIQTCRYLNSGPPDIFDNEQVEISYSHCEQCNANRIQLLYRPSLEPEARHPQTPYPNDTGTSLHGTGVLPASTDIPFEDPPPKYTPPPSYTTATGARIAKMLRQSFRRSVRRIVNVLGETSAPRSRAALQPPPPDYATVLVEMNETILGRDMTIHAIEPRPDVTDTGGNNNPGIGAISVDRIRPNTIDRSTRISSLDRCPVERTHSTIERNRRLYTSGTSNLTAADVANLLRSSIRRGNRNQQIVRRNSTNIPIAAASVENLVSAAAPIGEDSLVFAKNLQLVQTDNNDDNDDDDDDDDEHKKTGEMDNSISVI